MTDFSSVEQHLLSLGIAPLRGQDFVGFGDEVWDRLGLSAKARIPDVVRRVAARFGGFKFRGGARWLHPRKKREVLLGWFLDGAGLVTEQADYQEALPRDVVLLENDGGDNHLAVGVGPANHGKVYVHVHDAPRNRNLELVDESIEHFLLSLHPDVD